MIYEAIPNYFTKLSIDLIRKLISAIAVYLCNIRRCPLPYLHIKGSDYNYMHVYIFSNYDIVLE